MLLGCSEICLFPAFIILDDLKKRKRKRKRERAFPYALEMTSNQVVTFSMVTVALPGMLGEGDGDEVAADLCFCQPATFYLNH